MIVDRLGTKVEPVAPDGGPVTVYMVPSIIVSDDSPPRVTFTDDDGNRVVLYVGGMVGTIRDALAEAL